MKSCSGRAFVVKQLISVLKSFAEKFTWRRRNIVLPASDNVSTAVTESTAASSSKATIALAKKSSHRLQSGRSADATKVESEHPIECAVISSASVSSLSTGAHDVESGGIFGARTKGRFSANAHNTQFHCNFIELEDCSSESDKYNQMKIHMKTLTKISE